MTDEQEGTPDRVFDDRVDPNIPAPIESEFVQLTLEGTIIGQGMQTEDLYEPGTELRIKGERGTFIYRHATISRSGLVSLHLRRDHTFRAVRPEQVILARKGRRRK